jgi:hypothetical protein
VRARGARFFAAVAALLAVCACAARADDLAGRLGVGLTAGGVLPVGGNNNQLGADFGVWGRYGLNARWSAGLSVDDFGSANLASRLVPVLGTLAYTLDPKSAWNPSVRFDAGLDLISNAAGGSATGLAWGFGAGCDRFLTKRLSVGAVVDWLADIEGGHDNLRALRGGLTAAWWFDVPRK